MNSIRTTCASLLLLTMPLAALPQENGHGDVVSWTISAQPLPDSAGEAQYRLEISGSIGAGYVIYGPDFPAAMGPRPTRVRLDAPARPATDAAVKSTGTRKRTDKIFNSEYTYFEDRAQLSLQFVVAADAERVAGTIAGQTCYEADGTCALFSKRFDIPLPKSGT